VLRSVVLFVFLFFVMRMLGKKTLAEMSPFEMVMVIVMGDLSQQAVTQEDMSITGAMLAIATMMLLVVGLSYVSYRWPATRKVITGLPVVIIRDGRVVSEALRHEMLSMDDLFDAARERGIPRLEAIRLGVLEPDGKFSFISDEESGEPQD